jgi:hypothetical protein
MGKLTRYVLFDVVNEAVRIMHMGILGHHDVEVNVTLAPRLAGA